MLEKEPRLYFENVSYQLDKISYKAHKSNDVEKKLLVKISDSFELRDVSFENINILVTRTISFKPKSLYDLSVSIKLILPLNQGANRFTGTRDDLVNYVSENIESIINRSELMETLSLLISQISSTFGKVPIITPPMYLKDNVE